MNDIIPDKKWYSEIGKAKEVLPRCPFATADSCPRFYQSLSLLGSAGCTSIPENEDQRLLEKWKLSDLWPLSGEQETSISGPDGHFKSFSNFCPEVSFDNFGYFATYLHKHSDEIDIDVAHKHLEKMGAPPDHWGWVWSTVIPMHYTECPLYSILVHRSNGTSKENVNTTEKSPQVKQKSVREDHRDHSLLKWIVSLILLFLVCYQVYSGIVLKKVGVPGLFEVEFADTALTSKDVLKFEALMPFKTGWIFIGYFEPNRNLYTEGPYASVAFRPGTGSRGAIIPEKGDVLMIKKNRSVVIANYKTQNLKFHLQPPPLVHDPLIEADYTGVNLLKGKLVLVRDVEMSNYPGDPFSVWARVAECDPDIDNCAKAAAEMPKM